MQFTWHPNIGSLDLCKEEIISRQEMQHDGNYGKKPWRRRISNSRISTDRWLDQVDLVDSSNPSHASPTKSRIVMDEQLCQNQVHALFDLPPVMYKSEIHGLFR
ncbi:hypothetical protein Leryth_016772 [Lithospermum erythrorhizon]|nr:hypothetical protein Leryth_016772 [Lithospermum erythrorhizon]